MSIIQAVLYAAIGLFLVLRAAPLSMRYNGWTTQFRERHPNVNPPPTPEWRARNTKIMTVIIRVFGAFLFLLALPSLLSLIGHNAR
jgi:hypothetical protein